ncbi:chloride channel protein [Thiohalorhabdus methylotrophus]|uniref:Chloride channel protein n=1 Tax=Thiohalorhabdus methylotrophus TaxID=3242694 RepID=A0ABV4TPK0_9GAMM
MDLARLLRTWTRHWSLRLMALGVVVGVLAGLVVVLFRIAIGEAAELFTLGAGFAGLPAWGRLLLPAAGGLAVGLLAAYAFPRHADVGVSRVLERVAYGASHLGAKSAFAQFLFGTLAIGSGHSVGREGPSIHMGAAIGSLVGQRLGVPPEHLRILVAAGAAGAFSGALNIPLAGVVFALEVILGEYTLVLFAPVVVSAVIATVVAQIGIGPGVLLDVPEYPAHSLWFLPLDWFIGLGAALVSFALLRGVEGIYHLSQRVPVPTWALPGIGGLLVGMIAVEVPAVMGVSYGTMERVFAGVFPLATLAILLLAKLAATAVSIGAQARGGAIGPSLFMGALVGALVAEGGRLLGLPVGGTGIYAIIGMAAGMAAILNAPFSAIIAVFELVRHPGIILPVMLATVTAAVTSRDWFKAQSIFAWTLHLRELSEPTLPEAGQKCTVPVNEVMQSDYRNLPLRVDAGELRAAQSDSGIQVVFPVYEEGRFRGLVDLGGLLQAGLAYPDEEGRIDLGPYLHSAEDLRYLYPGDGAVKAMDLMASYGLEGFPVRSPRDPEVLIGLVNRTEVVRACLEQMRRRDDGSHAHGAEG